MMFGFGLIIGMITVGMIVLIIYSKDDKTK